MGVGQKSCTECKMGYYALANDEECKVCEAGKVPNKLRTDCAACPAGEEYYAEGSGDCNYPTGDELKKKRASPGTDVQVTKPDTCTKVECKACQAGHIKPAGSLKYCHRCAKDKEYTTDNENCIVCEKGKVANEDGDGCKNCLAGQYRGEKDDTCIACNAGSISAEGKSECEDCPAGHYEEKLLSCEPCPAGKYNEKTKMSGSASCISCSDGSVTKTK